MDPGTMSLIAGVLGGLMGGGGGFTVPGGVRADARVLRREGRDLIAQSKTPVGSLPQEQAMLASMNALMGQQFGQQRAALGALTSPYGAGAAFTPDMMANLLQGFLAQQQAGKQQAFQGFLGDRRGMQAQGLDFLRQASGMITGAMQPQQPSSSGANFAQFLGQYAQNQAYLNALKRMGQQNPPPGGGTGGGTGTNTNDPAGEMTAGGGNL